MHTMSLWYTATISAGVYAVHPFVFRPGHPPQRAGAHRIYSLSCVVAPCVHLRTALGWPPCIVTYLAGVYYMMLVMWKRLVW